jgi:hypothetical protein
MFTYFVCVHTETEISEGVWEPRLILEMRRGTKKDIKNLKFVSEANNYNIYKENKIKKISLSQHQQIIKETEFFNKIVSSELKLIVRENTHE